MATKRDAELARRKEYRRQDREAIRYLRTRVQELSLEVARQTSLPAKSSALPWREVALALDDSASSAKRANRALRDELRHYMDLACRMTTFVGHNVARNTFDPTSPCWHDNYLPTDPSTRQQGLAWNRQRLLHHVDSAVHEAAFPYSKDLYVDVRVDPQDCVSATRYEYIQRVVPMSLECVVAYLKTRTPVLASSNVLDTGPGWTYSRYTFTHDHVGLTFPFNVIAAYEISSHRAVAAVTSITDDALHPNGAATYRTTGWIVGSRLGPRETLLQEISMKEGLRCAATGAYIPMFPGDPRQSFELELAAYKEQCTQLLVQDTMCHRDDRSNLQFYI